MKGHDSNDAIISPRYSDESDIKRIPNSFDSSHSAMAISKSPGSDNNDVPLDLMTSPRGGKNISPDQANHHLILKNLMPQQVSTPKNAFSIASLLETPKVPRGNYMLIFSLVVYTVFCLM